MSELEYLKLSELISEKPRNGLYKGKEFQGKGSRWIKMNEVYGNDFFTDQKTELLDVTASEMERFNCQTGDLLFGRTSLTLEGIGDCLIVGELGDVPIFESNLFRIRFDSKKAYPLFYYYFFKSKAGKLLIQTIAKQTAATSITSTDLVTLPVPHYPLSTQNEIANQIYLLDKKIQLNRQINQTLESMAQAIFQSWFVDFDPVKAKIKTFAAGGSDEDADLAAMSVISAKTIYDLNSFKASNPEEFNRLQQTAALFPAAMQDSELGEIPEGWSISEIGNEVAVVGGGTPSTKNAEFWEDGTIHWTTPKDMSGLISKVLTNTDRKITDLGLKKISSGLLSENTVLMSSRAPVGYLALAKIPVAINQGYIAMKCEQMLSPEYVLLWCEHNMEEIKQRASGTTFAEISKANFKQIPAIVPNKNIVNFFTGQVSEIYNLVHSNVLQSDSLSNARDSLLPKLLSGELPDISKGGE